MGAVDGSGGGLEEEKPVMSQRTMVSSLAQRESIRSPWKATL